MRWLGVISAVLLVGVLVVWGYLTPRPLSISVSKIHPAREYQRVTDESKASNLSYPEKVLEGLDLFVSESGDLIEVTESQSHGYYTDIRGHFGCRQERPFDNRSVQFFHADQHGTISGDFGDVSLRYIGELSAGPMPELETVTTTFSWSDIQGRMLSDAEVSAVNSRQEDPQSATLPPGFGTMVRLGLHVQSTKDLHFLTYRVFDSQTRQEIMTTRSIYKGTGKQHRWAWIDGNWITHLPSPKWIILDGAAGISEWMEFDPKSEIAHEDFPLPIEYLGIVTGNVVATNSMPAMPYSYSRNVIHKVTQVDADDARFNLVFFKPPRGYSSLLHIELYDQAGRSIPMISQSQRSEMLVFTFEGKSSDIHTARLATSKEHFRFFFETQAPSSVPPMNGKVADLMDVQIPYARFDDGFQMLRFLSFSMQIKIQNNIGNPTQIRNRHYENVTLRQIWEDYLAYYSPGFRHMWNENGTAIIMQDHPILRRVLSIFE